MDGWMSRYLGDTATHALNALRHLKVARDACPYDTPQLDVRADLSAALDLLAMAIDGMGIDPETHEVRKAPTSRGDGQ